MVLALDNAGGGGPVVVDSAPAAMKMSELMTEIIVCDRRHKFNFLFRW